MEAKSFFCISLFSFFFPSVAMFFSFFFLVYSPLTRGNFRIIGPIPYLPNILIDVKL